MTEEQMVEYITAHGGEIYIVGGWIRDKLAGKMPKDKDYVLCKMREIDFCMLFPDAKKVGRAFPVYLLEVDGKKCEIAFARRELKHGHGYKGFTVSYNEDIAIEDDLFRRDSRMNSIAFKLPEKIIIDPFSGGEDIKNKIICATSIHFQEDPVRALRAARQAAEFDFTIEEATVKQMKECGAELRGEPAERIMNELSRALSAQTPSVFFRYLKKAALLDIVFPEIAALAGQTQPCFYHPEGDSFEHTMLILDTVAASTDDAAVRFAALCHDLGKGLTPQNMLPHHYGHEKSGIIALDRWHKRMTLPSHWYYGASFTIREHMRAARLVKFGKIVDLLIAIEKNPLGADGFCTIISADNKMLPAYLKNIHLILELFHSIDMEKRPAFLKGKQIGEWLREQRVDVLASYIKNMNI
ncbi:HD domain-containing protein [Pectinatus haikarae]|uniref:tRNA nucleotidyltransferase (CCA-adding enzyme) n=1 Tax=Pectinatus haikarae TaxID=349096 RepID=A0ABT9YBH8_9FIRM|nr:HD domain-containing protein [Pectinatus haikarae]MDQ0204901.1 tRNA nucleotidyltransferase (CCA-adding enzyme) [Pectinatus haikarae]